MQKINIKSYFESDFCEFLAVDYIKYLQVLATVTHLCLNVSKNPHISPIHTIHTKMTSVGVGVPQKLT